MNESPRIPLQLRCESRRSEWLLKMRWFPRRLILLEPDNKVLMGKHSAEPAKVAGQWYHGTVSAAWNAIRAVFCHAHRWTLRVRMRGVRQVMMGACCLPSPPLQVALLRVHRRAVGSSVSPCTAEQRAASARGRGRGGGGAGDRQREFRRFRTQG